MAFEELTTKEYWMRHWPQEKMASSPCTEIPFGVDDVGLGIIHCASVVVAEFYILVTKDYATPAMILLDLVGPTPQPLFTCLQGMVACVLEILRMLPELGPCSNPQDLSSKANSPSIDMALRPPGTTHDLPLASSYADWIDFDDYRMYDEDGRLVFGNVGIYLKQRVYMDEHRNWVQKQAST
ncbi:hypothetical protein PHMEG_00014303 [Phytophthora megakarya]|uniref:Uncharacterized protein n=1 Tax=Phytophthora megakarya TaxID=4795 RepID=A0A225W4L8_9STRA|nr:hypothetical protein PHMEG_00014303 [Phytophthora megakarya]